MTERIKARLSVIIANYNHARFLPVALQAILTQSCRPLEVIVIDDGSTDNSVEVIETFVRQDSVVRLYRNEQNKGVIFSTNRGLSLAVGEYVYFGAADDRICPGLFEKSIGMLDRHPDAGLCSALLQRIGLDGEDLGWIPTPVISNKPSFLPPKKVIADLTSYGSWFAGQTVVYRLDAIIKNTEGFPPELANRTDHFVNYVVAAKLGACFIPEILATYRIQPSGYAETVFDNEELSRGTFCILLELMRSPKYRSIFPESFVGALQERGWYDLEIRTLRRIHQSQVDLIERLKALKPKASLLDKMFFFLLTKLFAFGVTLTETYLLHRRVNWDSRYLAMKIKTYLSSYSSPPHNLLRPCPLCGGITYKLLMATDENCRISKTHFSYLKCSECKSVFLENPPTDLGRYYQSEYYVIPTIEQLQKVANKDRNKIDAVLRFAPHGRLLEVGPAFGVFAWQARQAGFVVDVIEMNARCCEYLQGTLGINVTQSDNPPAAMRALQEYEVIAIWHALEHLSDPLAFLRATTTNLKPGGVLAIAMPNPNAWQFKIMGRRWPHLDAPRHLTLISQAWITRQAEELGFEQVYLTSDDSDARRWNQFGWQRLLMNRFGNKFLHRVMFVLGYALSLIMAPFDRMNFGGSAYTIIFRKK